MISQEVRTVCSTCMVNVPEKGKTCNDCKEDRRRYGERVKAEKAAAKAAKEAKKAARLSN